MDKSTNNDMEIIILVRHQNISYIVTQPTGTIEDDEQDERTKHDTFSIQGHTKDVTKPSDRWKTYQPLKSHTVETLIDPACVFVCENDVFEEIKQEINTRKEKIIGESHVTAATR